MAMIDLNYAGNAHGLHVAEHGLNGVLDDYFGYAIKKFSLTSEQSNTCEELVPWECDWIPGMSWTEKCSNALNRAGGCVAMYSSSNAGLDQMKELPPVVPPPEGWDSTAGPGTITDQAVKDAVAEQVRQWQNKNREFMTAVSDQVDAKKAQEQESKGKIWVYGAAALAALMIFGGATR